MSKLFEPIKDKVIIKAFTYSNTLASGVILPDIAQESLNIGKIEAVGPGLLLPNGSYDPPQCKIGDVVVFPKYGAYHFEIGDDKYVSLREQDLITIITDTSILDKLNLNVLKNENEE